MRELLILLGLVSPDMTARVAVEAAVTIQSAPQPVETSKCCKQCVNGIIAHGDGHKTPCPCPPECECKRRKAEECKDGKCTLKR